MAQRAFFQNFSRRFRAGSFGDDYRVGNCDGIFERGWRDLFSRFGFACFDFLCGGFGCVVTACAVFRSAGGERLSGRGGACAVFYFDADFDLSDESVLKRDKSEKVRKGKKFMLNLSTNFFPFPLFYFLPFLSCQTADGECGDVAVSVDADIFFRHGREID